MMKWGVTLNVPAASLLQRLPEPSSIKQLTRSDGGMTIQATYHFEFAPQSWREWQRVAGIKAQIKHLINQCDFSEYSGDEVSGKLYTISELGKHFKQYIAFPKPQFPLSAGEQYSRLCRHAKRLHYEGLLYFEQLVATSWRFNEAMAEIDNKSRRGKQGFRQVMVVAKRAWEFAQTRKHEWPVKLSADELKASRDDSRRKGAAKTNGNKRGLATINGYIAKAIIDDGQSIKDAVEILGISQPTAYRNLSLARGMSEG